MCRPPHPQGRSPWAHHLHPLWLAQGGRCCWCGSLTFQLRDVGNLQDDPLIDWTDAWAERAPTGEFRTVSVFGEEFPVATVEHLIPRAAGGHLTNVGNLAMACIDCNQARNNLSPTGFVAYLGYDPGLLDELGISELYPPLVGALAERSGVSYG